MSRSVRLVPAFAPLLALTLVLTACDGGGAVHGTPGGSGVRDPYFPKLGNGGFDVTHYDLTLAYDPDRHHLTGTAVITARATQDLSAFDLDLEGLDVSDVMVEGRTARWNRAGQELTVRPARDLGKDVTFSTTVRYSGTPETITDPDGSKEGWLTTEDGALALGEPTGSMAWFPGNHHPSDKATYDLAITVPKGLEAVSNGELTHQSTGGGRTTYTWRTAEPMASYLAVLAIGPYQVTSSTLKTGLHVYTAVDPDQAEAGRTALAKLPEVLDWEQRNFGPYPFSSAGAIVNRPHDSGYALETQTRPVFPGAPDTLTMVHELAHEWYGDSVTPKSWRDMWLNEGFATYAEWLWEEDHGGDTAQQTFDAIYKGDYYDDPDQGKAVWAFPPAKPPSAEQISANPVYARGAMVLHKIRQTIGDRAFFALIQAWAADHRHGNADTAEFTAYVEKKEPGHDFSEIWRDWLYGDGRPAHE